MLRLPGTLLALALLLLLPAPGHTGTVHDLEPGAVHEVTPGGAECFTSSFVVPDEVDKFPLFCPIRSFSRCEPGGEANLSVISCVTLRAARGGAHGHYQYWFRVQPADDTAPVPTFVPIHIFAPDVFWDLKLINGALSEDAGVASATFFLRLRRDPMGDLSSRGEVAAQTPILLASHGGIGGCLSIPTGVDDVANLLISCTAASGQIQQGKASPSIAAVVEVGRTYSVELAMDLHVEKRATAKPTALEVGEPREMGDPPGSIANVLKWSKLVISIGTSTDDLQGQIDGLQAQVDALRNDLEGHAHPYLTGRGVGHNNTQADTGLPSFPGGASGGLDFDADGVPDGSDACPFSPWARPVDAVGCTANEFCAQHTERRTCRRADWRDDEPRARPRDCAWRQKACTRR